MLRVRCLVQTKTLSTLSLGVGKAEVRGANVLLQGEFTPVAFSAAVGSRPADDSLGHGKVGLAADEALLALVDGADVHS